MLTIMLFVSIKRTSAKRWSSIISTKDMLGHRLKLAKNFLKRKKKLQRKLFPRIDICRKRIEESNTNMSSGKRSELIILEELSKISKENKMFKRARKRRRTHLFMTLFTTSTEDQ